MGVVHSSIDGTLEAVIVVRVGALFLGRLSRPRRSCEAGQGVRVSIVTPHEKGTRLDAGNSTA